MLFQSFPEEEALGRHISDHSKVARCRNRSWHPLLCGVLGGALLVAPPGPCVLRVWHQAGLNCVKEVVTPSPCLSSSTGMRKTQGKQSLWFAVWQVPLAFSRKCLQKPASLSLLPWPFLQASPQLQNELINFRQVSSQDSSEVGVCIELVEWTGVY